MRAFKFFFAFSFMMIVFFFVAKIALTAMVIAAIMSLVFFIVRKVKYALRSHDHWDRYYEEREYRAEPLFETWQERPSYHSMRNHIVVIR